MYLYNTRNQVVAQAARGFESHPVRHKPWKHNAFKAFYFLFLVPIYFSFSEMVPMVPCFVVPLCSYETQLKITEYVNWCPNGAHIP